MDGWTANLAQLKLDRKAGDAALLAMTQNVSARMESKMRKSTSPTLLPFLQYAHMS